MRAESERRADPAAGATLEPLRERLICWLVSSAYPLWSTHGVDPWGGFVERISEDGQPLADDRRARVAPRQIFSFALATDLGWTGNVEELLRRGFDNLLACYRRPDGLYRTLVRSNGSLKDERALLYDQAFVLLAFAAASRALGPSLALERRAVELREVIETTYRAPQGGFRSGELPHDLRESNPHMHLLEACLAWRDISRDRTWGRWADEIAELALRRFVHSDTGMLTEMFTPTWEPAPGVEGRRVEPGHQFEWGWLLLRWGGRQSPEVLQAALRLIDTAERFGVRDGFAVNALLDDFAMPDPDARLWPQAERLKASLLAAQLTGEARYLTISASAARALAAFLNTPVAGLWFDQRRAGGQWVAAPSPASSFYHIVGAIHALWAAAGSVQYS
jgi:mannose/cellobiose epimerase-like protein (N-acyl-D-glucosamine 2-epimerase family)